MPEETVQGVQIEETGTRSWRPANYQPSDLEQAYKYSQPKSWKDLLDFLEHHAQNRWHLEPGEVIAMKEDAERAMKAGAPFSENSQQTYQEMHKFREQDLQKYGKPSAQQASRQS